MTIGKAIKKRRLEMGLTQEELAARLNVSRSCITYWEIGRYHPKTTMLQQVAQVLQMSVSELLGEEQKAG